MTEDTLVESDSPKKTVDDWLNEVDYYSLNHGNYQPSDFALKFANFIQLVNGAEGESNKTPVVHLKMLDKIATPKKRTANLCARGMAKTTLMAEYMSLYLAIFHEIPEFGKLDCMLYISDSMDNGVKSFRKNLEFRFHSSDFMKKFIKKWQFTDNFIEFTSIDDKRFAIKMFGSKTGLRGTKIYGKRPKLAVLDDLVSDEDAKSKASMEAIKDTVYKGINFALDPTKKKIIFNGTPFNKNDVLYSAVESGAWDVNVYPICERFPCTKEEFNGAWEDRFSYENILDEYTALKKAGELSSFNQEYMLRISSAEERLIQDSEIKWYERSILLKKRDNFNFYITTDFATTDKETSDYSVISVWALNYNGDWFLVDGMAKRQTMDKNIDDLFHFAVRYKPQSVGIEVTGQQGMLIKWLQKEMLERNQWFNLAQDRGKTGIHPTTNKLARFNLTVPWFKAGKMFFPEELRKSPFIETFLSQISFATINGIKGHDDCLDTISMLQYMNAWKPSEPVVILEDGYIYDDSKVIEDNYSMDSYIV